MFAKVVVDLKNEAISQCYDYEIPNNLEDFINVGTRVLVPFGFQDILGYVIELNENSDYGNNTKQIKAVLDFEQELTSEQIELAKYMSKYYYTSMASVLGLMIPSFLKGQKRRWIVVKDYDKLHPVLHQLFNGKTRINIDNKILEQYSLIKKEIAKENITLEYDLLTYGKTKKQRLYSVKNNAIFKNEKRNKIINFLEKYPESSSESIENSVNCSEYLIKKMVDEGYITYKEEVRLMSNNPIKYVNKDYQFTFDQLQTIERFDKSYVKNFLLFSNDEEFKINFYLHIIEENAKQKLPTIFIAPTLFIAEELYMFFKKKLSGYNIVTMNSKNSQSDNYDTFMNVKYGNFDVLVSTVSGLFLPFKSIGTFIMIDEENSFYLNENYPYYDSIDIIKYRSKYHNSKLVLTTSSPSISNYYSSEMGEFDLITSGTLKRGNVKIVDMKNEMLQGSDKIISNTLKQSIIDTLNNNKQVMLLTNNKAYSTVIKCRNCGEILKCPTCGIPLTLFKEKNFAKCTYCDYKVMNYDTCSKCGSKNVATYGYGLEQVKETLERLFPYANILQVDSDSLKNLDYYIDAITRIEDGSVNIIIGTNVLTKYINNSNIELVALLSGDRLLNLNDYRANEYTYNNIAKIINNDKVIIQTYYPNNTIINYASKGDYEKYYEEEIDRRKKFNYVPFMEVSKITITGDFKEMYHFANYFKKVYTKIISENILGPSYDYKIKGVKLIIKNNDFDKVIKIYEDTKITFKNKNVICNFERKPKVL